MLSNEMAMAVNEFIVGGGLHKVGSVFLFIIALLIAWQNISLKDQLERLKRQIQPQNPHTISGETVQSEEVQEIPMQG